MFFDNLKSLCKINNIKITPLLEKLNISKGAIARWRNGVLPNGETLIKIANYFNCSIDYLLGRTGNPNFSEENKITEQEYQVLSAYRQNTNMQQAVNKLLGVNNANSDSNNE